MAATSSSLIRTWRTAFLTLRDETLTTSPPKSSDLIKPIAKLLHDLIFSHSDSLVSAAPDLPPHEVTSDLLFLLELATAKSSLHRQDFISISSHISLLIHDICVRERVPLQLNSSSWTLILDSFAEMLRFLLGNVVSTPLPSSNAAHIKPSIQCLETIRHLVGIYQQKCLLPNNVQLVKILLCIIECSHAQFIGLYNASANQRLTSTRKRMSKYTSLFEVHTLVFTILGETYSIVGSSFHPDIWQSTIEVLRKVMDVLASKSLLSEDNVMSRFYVSLLNCLHLVLTDPKGSLLGHIPPFVVTLRMFFVYGLTSRPQFSLASTSHKGKELGLMSLKTPEEHMQKDHAPYRPPHLRKKDNMSANQSKAKEAYCLSTHESSITDFMSSDSDCSDSDGLGKNVDSVQSSKVRVAAIVCIQDLCQADPKSFTTQWTLLLPTNDVLQPRKFEATLMTCLLFDPYLKARIASASTLAAMLDGSSSVFLQVAEYKEPTKRAAFMALSTSLGQILIQIHTGILYLIQRETHSRLLASLFRILVLLISSTPYSRIPPELLPTVITSLLARIENGFPFKNDQTGLLATCTSCLTAALSVSPSSPRVKEMLLEEISTDAVVVDRRSGVLSTLFQYSNQLTGPTICFEALQALRAVIHNYPDITFACWEKISATVSKILKVSASEVPMRTWKGRIEDNVGFVGEKVITAAIKVLDEYLRVISGFKGTEDLLDDKLLDMPFTSDCIRMKKVSSAPSYEHDSADLRKEPELHQSGSEQWSNTIENHIPLILWHTSAMVRTASITCFAGITSFVFFSLAKEKQEFIVSSLINAALHDEVASVRLAACRAIGVICCFPHIYQSAEILDKFIHAIEINTRDPLVSVRITSSWALANICDSLRHCIDDFPSTNSSDLNVNLNSNSQLMIFMTECALRLAKDGDKIKSNAVRALGSLSRYVKCTPSSVHDKHMDSLDLSTGDSKVFSASNDMQVCYGYAYNSCHPSSLRYSQLLDRMVQAFLSCVTTGNVKVQWNVCHALSNLFLNETLKLHDMDWAPSVFSVLLLLLRDSSNYKIRIQAAAALAVPASVIDYGKSFSDVIQGLQHVLENLSSDQISAPSSFKYRDALEKQITSTMLHVLSLSSSTDHQPLKDFLVKKAPFLEEWFKGLCSSLEETSDGPEAGNSAVTQKKQMISKAIQSLVVVYESRNLKANVQKFEKLDNSLW